MLYDWNPPPNPWRNHLLLEGLDVPGRLLPDPVGRSDRPPSMPPPAVPARSNPVSPEAWPIHSGGTAELYPQIGFGEELDELARLARSRGGVKSPPDVAASVLEWLRTESADRAAWVGDYLSGKRTLDDLRYRFRVPKKKILEWSAHAKKVLAETGELPIPGFRPKKGRELFVHPQATFFSSALANPGDMQGFYELGRRIRRRIYPGITVGACMSTKGVEGGQPPEYRIGQYTQCMDAVKVLGSGRAEIRFFVDSGAFKEVDEVPGSPPRLNKTKEIRDKAYVSTIRERGKQPRKEVILGWQDRLAAYEEIASHLGPRAFLVAPDMVGNPRETLKRMGNRSYRDRILYCALDFDAHVLAPVQGGGDMVTFWNKVRKIYRKIDRAGKLIPAFPMAKGACALEELLAFLRKVRPNRIHLLGVGPNGTAAEDLARTKKIKAKELMERVCGEFPDMEVMHDAVLLKSGVGRGFVGVGNLDVLSQAQDLAYRAIATEAFIRSTRGGKQSSLGLLSLRRWVPERGWKADDLPDWEDNLEEENVGWFTPKHRERLVHLIQRFEKSGKGVLGYFLQWRWAGRRPRLTGVEREMLMDAPSVFFATDVMPGTPPGRSSRVIDKRTGRAVVELPAWKHVLADFLNEEWAHFLAADFVALKKSEAIKRAWVAASRGSAGRGAMPSELGRGSEEAKVKAVDKILEDEWGPEPKKKAKTKKAPRKPRPPKKHKPLGFKRGELFRIPHLPTTMRPGDVMVVGQEGNRIRVKIPGTSISWTVKPESLRR